MTPLREEWLIWPPLPTQLREAERLVARARFEVPPSHRPLIGPAITSAKRVFVHGLAPLHRRLLAPQARFNRAALDALRSALAGSPPSANLAALAELRDARPASRRLLRRQIEWNRSLAAALGAAGSDSAEALHAPLLRSEPLAPGPLFELLRPQAEVNRALAGLAAAALNLHATALYEYDGYRIPKHLLELTGSSPEYWAGIARAHLADYALHAPIAPDQHVLEVGCGIGRDAMHLAPLLAAGRYTGVDVTAPSIEWCRRNISARHPQCGFFHLDVKSDLYNPSGALTAEQVTLPVADGSVDRILLQSVFTHLFAPAVARYLREFRRTLKPGGLVHATLFHLDDASLAQARSSGARLTFRHAQGGGAFADSANAPEEAVGFTPDAFAALVAEAGLRIVKLVPGSWPGRAANGYQDAAVLARG